MCSQAATVCSQAVDGDEEEYLRVYVVHGADVVDGDVHGVDHSFDKSRTESRFCCRILGDILGAIAERIFNVGIRCFGQEQAAGRSEGSGERDGRTKG